MADQGEEPPEISLPAIGFGRAGLEIGTHVAGHQIL
jgi:hypothetical protein